MFGSSALHAPCTGHTSLHVHFMGSGWPRCLARRGGLYSSRRLAQPNFVDEWGVGWPCRLAWRGQSYLSGRLAQPSFADEWAVADRLPDGRGSNLETLLRLQTGNHLPGRRVSNLETLLRLQTGNRQTRPQSFQFGNSARHKAHARYGRAVGRQRSGHPLVSRSGNKLSPPGPWTAICRVTSPGRGRPANCNVPSPGRSAAMSTRTLHRTSRREADVCKLRSWPL